MNPDKIELRRKDFRTAIVLIAVALFFLTRTAALPFFKADAAGVDAAQWYNSAALVPYLIFGALLLSAIGLLVVAIRGGGAPKRLALPSWTWPAEGGQRVLGVSIIILAYIFALVPRVDFVLASALVFTALVTGLHQMRGRALLLAVVAVLIPAAYALLAHFPQAEWNAPHDDDWVVLFAFLILVPATWIEARLAGARLDRALRYAPVAAILIPVFLVCAMAFGFRQNVPNRGGLVFQQIEYHYYVTLRPLWSGPR